MAEESAGSVIRGREHHLEREEQRVVLLNTMTVVLPITTVMYAEGTYSGGSAFVLSQGRRADAITIRPVMNRVLGIDHGPTNGAGGAGSLLDVKAWLEAVGPEMAN